MKTIAKLALPVAAATVAAPLLGAQAAQTAQAAGSEHVITAYTTGYTWFDNTPVGSAEIAHPVIHQYAGGTGTYANPITLATASGAFPAGTRFYVPNLHRYFIAEDIGGSNMYNPPAGASYWLDLWVGGKGGTASGADACSSAITANHKVIVNPKAGYAVQTGDIYDGTCHGGFGESVSRSVARTSTPVRKVTVKASKQVSVKKTAHHVAVAAHKTYTVKAGDTLSAIAKANGTSWQKLFKLNKKTMSSPNVLRIGQVIVLR